MTEMVTPSSLLDLPTEIKLQIWEYAFGHIDIPLCVEDTPTNLVTFNDPPNCEACTRGAPELTSYAEDSTQSTSDEPRGNLPSHGYQRYSEAIEPLYASKTIFSEAIEVFQSTLTFHIKSPEALALVRHSAPTLLQERATRLMLYIHFDNSNHFLWCMRLFELKQTFPNLKHLSINYHMRPPISYDNLLDASYLCVTLLGLHAPFDRPLYITKADDRPSSATKQIRPPYGPVVPCTDRKPGMTVHTTYMVSETLFSAHFLGDITTEDAIDDHTSVIRALFHDQLFTSSTRGLLQANARHIQTSVAASYPPNRYPIDQLQAGFPEQSWWHAVQHALLLVARRYEKPWFEKLQRRRIVEVYVEQGRMTTSEAETLLNRQLAALPEGQGIDDFVQQLMLQGDDVAGIAGTFGFGQGEDIGDGGQWPAAWVAEQAQEQQAQQEQEDEHQQ